MRCPHHQARCRLSQRGSSVLIAVRLHRASSISSSKRSSRLSQRRSSISITTALNWLLHRGSSISIATILHRGSSISITTSFGRLLDPNDFSANWDKDEAVRDASAAQCCTLCSGSNSKPEPWAYPECSAGQGRPAPDLSGRRLTAPSSGRWSENSNPATG